MERPPARRRPARSATQLSRRATSSLSHVQTHWHQQRPAALAQSELAHFPWTNDDATIRLTRATTRSAWRYHHRHFVARIDVDLIADRRVRAADRIGDKLKLPPARHERRRDDEFGLRIPGDHSQSHALAAVDQKDVHVGEAAVVDLEDGARRVGIGARLAHRTA